VVVGEEEMARNQKVIATMILGLVVSLLAAGIVTVLAGNSGWVAYLGWLIFFASLQSTLVMHVVQTGKADPCTEWLLRLVRLQH
jgi:hypothetical protein